MRGVPGLSRRARNVAEYYHLRVHSYAPVPPPPGEPTGEQGRRAPARRWVVPVCVLFAVALLVPVLWVTGGLAATPRQPAASPGERLDLGQFTVTVRDARIGMATARFGNKKERFLIVRMRVVNQGKETASLGTGGLTDGVVALTKAGKWVKPDQVRGVAAGAETGVAQPGLPVEASAMWKMGPTGRPRKLTVGLREWKYEHGFTDSDFKWLVFREDDELAGRMTLPVAAMSPAPRPSSSRAAPRPSVRTTPRATPTTTRRATRPSTRRPTPRATARSPRPTASRR